LREGEEERIGQERSEKKSWAWFPEKEGDFIVGVRVVDKKESREAEIPFVIKKKEKNITNLDYSQVEDVIFYEKIRLERR
jgi:hypothetical protein